MTLLTKCVSCFPERYKRELLKSDAHQLDEILDGFEQEGWLVKSSDGDATEMGLTGAGKTEREVIFKLRSEVRGRVWQGIIDQEYSTVIDVLQHKVCNLE